MEKKDKCQHCGSQRFVTGRQSGYGGITPNKSFTMRNQILYHIVCVDCGTVVRSYVERPDKLFTDKDRY